MITMDINFVIYNCGVLWMLFRFLGTVNSSAVGMYETDYCEGETFRAQCEVDEVIVMARAVYGRMEVGRCINNAYGVIDCSLNVLSIMDSKCSGRRSCEVPVTDVYTATQSNPPCGHEHVGLRGYLIAKASCVKVFTPLSDCRNTFPETIQTSSGILSSSVTTETNCGSLEKPWKIVVPKGQSIKLTMTDFMAESRDPSLFRGDIPVICEVYFNVKEIGLQTQKICGSLQKDSEVHVSSTNEIELRLIPGSSEGKERHFILQFQAIGCREIQAPPYGWVKQTPDQATLGCNFTDEIWDLICEGNTWHGNNRSCDAAKYFAGASMKAADSSAVLFEGSQWLVILVIGAIAVTIGVFIFMAGLVYLKRKKMTDQSNTQSPYSGDVAPYYAAHLIDPNGGIPDYSGTHPRSKYIITSADGSILGHYPPNDYSRTWQMQRHKKNDVIEPLSNQGLIQYSRNNSMSPAQQYRDEVPRANVHRQGTDVLPEPPKRVQSRQVSQIDGRPIHHVYESPQFERKCNSLDNPRIKANSSSNSSGAAFVRPLGNVTYYELDPKGIEKKKKNGATK